MLEGELRRTRPRRVLIQGPSGSGKTTLAASLAKAMGVPRLELDAVFHQPNWTPLDTETFRDIVATFVAQPSWVCDGNYSAVRDLLWERADVIVFIQLSRRRVFFRVLRRTIRRGLFREEMWNGNHESLRNLFSRVPEQNIVLWSWTKYHLYTTIVPDEARRQAAQAEIVLLGGPREVKRFLHTFVEQ